MRRLAITVAAPTLVVLVATQVLLPRYLERRIERRLTASGGSAHVELSAFPALRLLAGGGDRLRVSGHGLTIGLLSTSGRAFGKLDSFGRVDVRVSDTHAGPFVLRTAELERSADHGSYRLMLRASATAGDVAAYVGGQLGGGLGSLLGGIGAGGLPFTSAPVPINLDATVESQDGRPALLSVNGSIAGFPAAPVVEALAAALAGRF